MNQVQPTRGRPMRLDVSRSQAALIRTALRLYALECHEAKRKSFSRAAKQRWERCEREVLDLIDQLAP